MRRDEFNTDTRTVTTYDESGEVVSTLDRRRRKQPLGARRVWLD